MSGKHFRHDAAPEEVAVSSEAQVVQGLPVGNVGPGAHEAHHEDESPVRHGQAEASAQLPDLSRLNAAAHYIRRRGGRQRSAGLRRLLVATCVIAAAVAAGIAAFTTVVGGRLSRGVGSELRAVLAEAGDRDPFYMLLVGVAQNEETDPELDAGARLADAVMLVRVDTAARRVALVSVPRDALVDLGDAGRHRLNATYATGGAAALTRAVGELTGLPIAHYAEVDLGGLAAAIDRLGGVDLSLPVGVSDPDYTGLDLAAGDVHLDGYDAIMLARCRHAYDAYGTGEACRMANHRAIAVALADTLRDTGLFALPGRVASLSDVVTTDLGALSVVRLVRWLRGCDLATDVSGGQLPTSAVAVDDLWYEQLDADAWAAMAARIEAGEPPYEDGYDDPTVGVSCVPAETSDDSDDETVGGSSIEPDYSGTVGALNGTDVEGLAADVAGVLSAHGFEASAANAPAPSEVSRVVYNGDDSIAKAMAVAEVLGIEEAPVANDGSLPIDANVVVLLGLDATDVSVAPGEGAAVQGDASQ